eukprot:Cvel_20340.t1-p1 / transcript=Cvel_20340.t1 / gene=Cvel_20340 / organism=Chromera_velia_CCMP2878 / gene_product=hypothetical protein / transcript_product=hypothetical protein / location=Cvel_scaffold1817:28240-39047(+) / protein_length=517 / sequence_SO=supercontig / SO=protein_coding / is_pseudo=false
MQASFSFKCTSLLVVVFCCWRLSSSSSSSISLPFYENFDGNFTGSIQNISALRPEWSLDLPSTSQAALNVSDRKLWVTFGNETPTFYFNVRGDAPFIWLPTPPSNVSWVATVTVRISNVGFAGFTFVDSDGEKGQWRVGPENYEGTEQLLIQRTTPPGIFQQANRRTNVHKEVGVRVAFDADTQIVTGWMEVFDSWIAYGEVTTGYKSRLALFFTSYEPFETAWFSNFSLVETGNTEMWVENFCSNDWSNDCSNRAVCTENYGNGSFICTCNEGWYGSGVACFAAPTVSFEALSLDVPDTSATISLLNLTSPSAPLASGSLVLGAVGPQEFNMDDNCNRNKTPFAWLPSPAKPFSVQVSVLIPASAADVWAGIAFGPNPPPVSDAFACSAGLRSWSGRNDMMFNTFDYGCGVQHERISLPYSETVDTWQTLRLDMSTDSRIRGFWYTSFDRDDVPGAVILADRDEFLKSSCRSLSGQSDSMGLFFNRAGGLAEPSVTVQFRDFILTFPGGWVGGWVG